MMYKKTLFFALPLVLAPAGEAEAAVTGTEATPTAASVPFRQQPLLAGLPLSLGRGLP
jgi:hypothetical protein